MEAATQRRGRARRLFGVIGTCLGVTALVSALGAGVVEAEFGLPAPIPYTTDVTDSGFTVNVDTEKFDCAGYLFEIHSLPGGKFVTRDSGNQCKKLHSIPVSGLNSCQLYQVTVRSHRNGEISDLRRTTVFTLCEPVDPPDGVPGPPGPQGPQGPQGPAGADGQDGADGADGR